MQKNIVLAVCAVLLLALGIGLGVSWKGMPETPVPQKQAEVTPAPAAVAPVAPVPTPVVEKASLPPLAEAMSLLPTGLDVTGGAKINEEVYWVSAEVPKRDDENNRPYQSWIVNVKTKKITLAKSRVYGIPYVKISADPFSTNYGYLRVDTEAGWEGVSMSYQDYFDVKDGSLHVSIDWQNQGPSIGVESSFGKHLIQLAPKDACKGLKQDKDVMMTGLDVDGTVIPFSKPKTTKCYYSEMSGEATLANFRWPSYSHPQSPDRDLLMFGLPWGDGVGMDLRETDVKKAVTISEVK